MDNYEFFELFGVWILPSFLSQDTVESFRWAAQENPIEKSKVAAPESMKGGVVDERKRKSDSILVSREVRQEIRKRIFAIQPFLESRFNIRLVSYEGPQMLVYHPGDFFKVHRDRPPRNEHLPDQRQVSITIFLSSHWRNGEGDYQGGELALFCPFRQTGRSQWIEVQGIKGALIAFRSSLPHQVLPIRFGQRITIVGWFH